jgi:hypothetical protein
MKQSVGSPSGQTQSVILKGGLAMRANLITAVLALTTATVANATTYEFDFDNHPTSLWFTWNTPTDLPFSDGRRLPAPTEAFVRASGRLLTDPMRIDIDYWEFGLHDMSLTTRKWETEFIGLEEVRREWDITIAMEFDRDVISWSGEREIILNPLGASGQFDRHTWRTEDETTPWGRISGTATMTVEGVQTGSVEQVSQEFALEPEDILPLTRVGGFLEVFDGRRITAFLIAGPYWRAMDAGLSISPLIVDGHTFRADLGSVHINGGKFDFVHIPEPSTAVLTTLGYLGLLAYGWRRRKHTT